MKILKNYALALVALAIATTSFTLMSFETNKNVSETWFNVHPTSGAILSRITSGQPDQCEANPSLPEYCAVSFMLEDPDNDPAPITNVQNDPNGEIVTLLKKDEDN